MNCTIEQALCSIFWYEGLIDKEYSSDSLVIQMIKDLRASSNFYTMDDVPKEFEIRDRHTIIWQMLVEMFGSCGTSPRTGWIEDTQECANFLERVIHSY